MTSSHFKGGSKSERPTFHGSCDSYDKLCPHSIYIYVQLPTRSFLSKFSKPLSRKTKVLRATRSPGKWRLQAVRSVCFQSAPDLMDIFFWCSLTSVIVLSPSTNLKVGLSILSMSPCVLRCEILWWHLTMHTMVWGQKGHFRLGEILPSDSEFCISMECILCDSKIPGRIILELKWFDITDRTHWDVFLFLEPFVAMWILFWVFANGEEIHWCRAEWQGAWMGSRSREPRLVGTCQGMEAVELVE